MKEFFDWYYENNKIVNITISGLDIIINGFCDAKTLSMAIDCGCTGISVEDTSIMFQFSNK